MINYISIVFMFLTLLVCFVLPIVLILWFNRKYRSKPEMFAAGFIVFLVFELFTRLPFLSAITEKEQYVTFLSAPILYALLLGFSAGLFDEVGRFIYYRTFVRDHMTWENGVAMGIGFGSLEAMVVTGGVYARRFMFAVMFNLGRFGTAESNPDIAALVEELQSIPLNIHLFAGLERIFMLVIHTAFSLLTMIAAKRGKLSLLLLCTVIHGLTISAAVFLNESYAWLSQLYLLALAVASWIFVVKTSKKKDLFTKV